MIEKIVNVERVEDLIAVFGSFDENIRRIEDALGVNIVNRGNELKIVGDAEAVDKAARTLEGLLTIAARGEVIDEQRVRYLLTLVQEGNDDQVTKIAKDVVCISAKGKPIKAKTVGQQNYMKAIQKNTITIGVGPAGTGKTYLAVAAAVAAFRERQVNRIILTRPAVEAGERLGFLPGDLQNKVDPYLRPLYDALFDMLGAETFQKYQERGSIEVAPLAYMREKPAKPRESCVYCSECINNGAPQAYCISAGLRGEEDRHHKGHDNPQDINGDEDFLLCSHVKIVAPVNGIFDEVGDLILDDFFLFIGQRAGQDRTAFHTAEVFILLGSAAFFAEFHFLFHSFIF